jgi:hypothetical protein
VLTVLLGAGAVSSSWSQEFQEASPRLLRGAYNRYRIKASAFLPELGRWKLLLGALRAQS